MGEALKIVCISDTHLRHDFPIPEGDVLIHAGDALLRGTLDEFEYFREWFCSLPHRHKIFVPGNHDWPFKDALPYLPGVHVLIDSAVTLGTIKFYGAPWTPEFFNWCFNLPRGAALREKWALIPDDTDVLITHGPPRGILDMTMRGENVGCADLAAAVLRVRPHAHVFGHIHHAYGAAVAYGVLFFNASICTERYLALNAPHILSIWANDE